MFRSKDPRERNDLSEAQPGLMEKMWAELNTSWYGYFHSRSPAAMLGPCNEPCARQYWIELSGGANLGGPTCGVPGCADAPPSPTPSPPGPEPHFAPVNSTNCTWVEGGADSIAFHHLQFWFFRNRSLDRNSDLADFQRLFPPAPAQYDRRVSKGAITHAKDKEGCCRHCYENEHCVAAAFHETEEAECFLHYSTEGWHTGQNGVVGCVTTRQPHRPVVPLVSEPWPRLGAEKKEWVGGNRHPSV